VPQPTVIVRSRRATVDDQGLLRELFAESRPDFALLPEAAREQLIQLQYDSQRAQYRAAAPDAIDWILEVEAGDRIEPVGRSYVWQQAHEHRLLDLAIRRDRRGRGIGRAVLEALQAEATAAGVPLRLTVWHDNHDALRLYRRLGFVVDGGDQPAVPAGYLSLRWTAGAPR
jgi:ribosomal protein S18 acetylase RimI-like enzyme